MSTKMSIYKLHNSIYIYALFGTRKVLRKENKEENYKKGLNLILNSIFLFKLILRNLKICKNLKNFDFFYIFHSKHEKK